MNFERLRGYSTLSAKAAQNLARDLQSREEFEVESSFRRFLDREGIQGDERSLALGDIDLDEFKERLRRFFGLGLSLAAAALFLFSLASIFGGQSPRKSSAIQVEKPLVAQELGETRAHDSFLGVAQP